MKILCFCLLAMAAGTLTVNAQTASAGNPLTTEAQQAWNRTFHNVVAGAEAMPADKYNYKPTPESMSFRDIVAHVADSAMGACSALVEGTRKTAGAAKLQTKEELAGALKAAQAECDKAYAPDDSTMAKMSSSGMGSRSRLTTLWGNTVHIEHEYAQMAVHLRINGVVPPSTAERPPMPARPAAQ